MVVQHLEPGDEFQVTGAPFLTGKVMYHSPGQSMCQMTDKSVEGDKTKTTTVHHGISLNTNVVKIEREIEKS